MAINAIRISRFALVGIVATAVHYITAMASSFFLPVIAANPLGFLAAVAISYFGHMKLTFALPAWEQRHSNRLPRFVITAVAGFALGQVIVTALCFATALADWLILAIALSAVPIFTYVMSSAWVFSVRHTKSDRPR